MKAIVNTKYGPPKVLERKKSEKPTPSMPILATKLFIPTPRPELVLRPRLIEQLNEGMHRKLTLISAPAGFGKTALVSEWVAGCLRPTAWLSMDKGDNDPIRFLSYLITALQRIESRIGQGLLGMFQSSQIMPSEAILTALINEVTSIPDHFTLVLDDYHVIDTEPVENILAFLLEHLPPQMHLVIATRMDPNLPLSRLRARNQLTELRVRDLRFTLSEAAGLLNQVMGLSLSPENIAVLENRTEGWIAGLQLAALSMRGHKDSTSFIKSFTGSDHFVLDYLLEEVLHQQSESIQAFLLQTSILDRLCGPLCDAILLAPSASGQEILEHLEHANLFIVPLDNERRWYRYHHLFADLLRQRLLQTTLSPKGNEGMDVAELNRRASVWYENHGMEIEAFHHAVAANDVERAANLMEGKGMPLHFRGAVSPVLNWLESLPKTVLDSHPSLWVMYASVLSISGQLTGVEPKLQAAERAMQGAGPDDKTRNLIGHIAAIRALMAAVQNNVETIITQSRRALEYLDPDNLAVRTATMWKMGWAYQLQGDRTASRQAYTEAISNSKASGNNIISISATIGLGNIQEAENQLHLAFETYHQALQMIGDSPLLAASEAHLGLARIYYEWNDLNAAEQHGQQGLQIARQIENNDKFVACYILLARLKLVRGDATGAATILAKAGQSVHQHNFVYQIPGVAAAQVLTMLHQDNLLEAAHIARTYEIPISQARVYLAQGDPSAALAALEPVGRHAKEKGWDDERLKVMVLQAVCLYIQGEKDKALPLLADSLTLAEPGGFIRIFVDEGISMARLLSEAAARGIMPDYTGKLLAVFEAENPKCIDKSFVSPVKTLIEPLSQRELEILKLIAQGLSNHEISEKLFLALDTVKGHNRRIYGKLQVQRRTEAVARARELGLL